jgi:AcrR family transcriptional regulator
LITRRQASVSEITDPEKHGPLSRRSWLEAGLHHLTFKGIRALRLRPLAASLSISTGSFYHHFNSFDEYLGQLARFYCDEHLMANLSVVTREARTPRQKIERLVAMAHHQGLDRMGLAMRAWGRSDPRAQQAVAALDKTLLDYLTTCFEDMGFEPLAAQARAVLLLSVGTTDMIHSLAGHLAPDLIEPVIDTLCQAQS